MIDTAFLITSFVTLFVIIDPIGLMPVFLALTQGMTSKQRRAIAIRASITGVGILAVFALFGPSRYFVLSLNTGPITILTP